MKNVNLTVLIITLFISILGSLTTTWAQPPHETRLRLLEGAFPRKPYESELVTRINKIHEIGYERWINNAWATMLIEKEIIPKEYASQVAGLLLESWKPEDGHYGIYYSGFQTEQNYVINKLGKQVGGNINIARTSPPNRQTMPVRHKLLVAMCIIHDVQEELINAAEKYKYAIMPGYTHIRHAQTMTLGHYLLSVHDAIERSMGTVEESYNLMNLSEMGCGALSGTSWDIDRNLVATYLGMDGIIENSNDAVGYSDGFLIVVAGIANVMNVASRMALDLNYWSTLEYGFINDEYRGGSFMMPQKNSNQAYLERVRIGAAKTLGYLTDVTAMAMRVPHGDMVEMLHVQDGPIFALDGVDSYLSPMVKQLKGMTVNTDRMLEVAKEGFSCASELANQMVRDYKIDYRTAHEIVHNFVEACENQKIPAAKVKADMLDVEAEKVIGKKLNMTDKRIRELLNPEHFVLVTNSQGGIAPIEVQRMINVRRGRLNKARQRQISRIEGLENSQKSLIGRLKDIAAE
jgi:argininosuccinate lyase